MANKRTSPGGRGWPSKEKSLLVMSEVLYSRPMI